MPGYTQYKCENKKCGHEFGFFTTNDKDNKPRENTRCPECGGRVHHVPHHMPSLKKRY